MYISTAVETISIPVPPTVGAAPSLGWAILIIVLLIAGFGAAMMFLGRRQARAKVDAISQKAEKAGRESAENTKDIIASESSDDLIKRL